MLEFAMPDNTSGKWRVTVLANINTGGGFDANGRSIEQNPLFDDFTPQIGVHIGPAGHVLFNDGLFPDSFTTQTETPVPDTGAVAFHINVTAEKAPVSSLYVNFYGFPFSAPYALAVYDVSAEPLDPVINTKPGKRRAYFS